MAAKIRFRVAAGLAAWSAGDFDLTFEAGPVHEVPDSKKGLAQAVRDAADAGSVVIVDDDGEEEK